MSCELPPGFRFHPTDEELIVHYLRNQATSRPCPVSIIPEINIYQFDPWQLPEKSSERKSAFINNDEGEWYFFSPRDRKYPNGARPNRATTSGYWKATGTDKAIYSGSHYVGVKKALVFYRGRPPRGTKTDWIMHEYRLIGGGRRTTSAASSMRLDDWVLCRIYQKKQQKSHEQDRALLEEDSYTCSQSSPPAAVEAKPALADFEHQSAVRFPRSCSLAHLLQEAEYMSVSQILSEYPFDSGDNLHAIASSGSVGIGADGELDKFYPSSGGNTSNSLLFNPQSLAVDPIFQY